MFWIEPNRKSYRLINLVAFIFFSTIALKAVAEKQCSSIFSNESNFSQSQLKIPDLIQDLYLLKVESLSSDVQKTMVARRLFSIKFRELEEYFSREEIEAWLENYNPINRKRELSPRNKNKIQSSADQILYASRLPALLKKYNLKDLEELKESGFVIIKDTYDFETLLLDPDFVNAQDAAGNTILLSVTSLGRNNNKIFNMLLGNSKVDFNAKNNDGFTALHNSVVVENESFAKALLEKNINPNIENKYGWTPVLSSSSHVKLDMLRTLIEMGADPNLPNFRGETALIVAVSYNRVENVKYLISKKVNLNARTGQQKTALMIAKENKNLEIIKILEDAGATE